MGDVILAEGKQRFEAKYYLDKYYHRLSIREWMSEYMVLPSFKTDGVKYWPIVRTLPMGWSHSVHFAQQFNLAVIRKVDIPPQDKTFNKVAVREI